MKWIIWSLYATVVIYSMLDGVQTIMLLDVGAKEVNPIVNWFIEVTGTVYSIFYIKIAALVLLLVLLDIHLKNSFEVKLETKDA